MAQSILLYGQTGSFKTSNIAEYIEWLYARYGGIVRGVFGDNFGPCRQQIKDGILQAVDLTAVKDPLGMLLLFSKGYWPEEITPEGQIIKMWPKGSKPNFNGVAGYAIEGFDENAELIMRDLEAKKQSTGEPLGLCGKDSPAMFDLINGERVDYAMVSRGSYRFLQLQTYRYYKLGFKGLPVPWVAVTSHEYFKGATKESPSTKWGVSLAGPALTKVIPQWFDHCLHFECINVEAQAQRQVGNKIVTDKVTRAGSHAHFAPHMIDNRRWYAKLGVEPYLMAHIYRQWPSGYIPLLMQEDGQYVSSVRTLLELIDPAPSPATAEGAHGESLT